MIQDIGSTAAPRNGEPQIKETPRFKRASSDSRRSRWRVGAPGCPLIDKTTFCRFKSDRSNSRSRARAPAAADDTVRSCARPTSDRRRRLLLPRGPQLVARDYILHAPQVARQTPVEHGVEGKAGSPGHHRGHRQRKAERKHVAALATARGLLGLRLLVLQVEPEQRLREEAHG